MAIHHCKLCAAALAAPATELYALSNITSDCRPWPAGRSVAACEKCGLLQRVLLPEAVAIFDRIYSGYAMFSHAEASSDQLNFDASGAALGRTAKILKFIEPKLQPRPSAVLDIGSGSGAGLIALAKQFPAARVHGFEPNDRPAERQILPANVSVMTTRPAGEHSYDLITLFHVLEHVEDVPDLMKFIASSLAPGGRLLIQVPYPVCTPFDLVIADHIWHFSKKSLAVLLSKFGFTITYIGNDLIEKELTVLSVAGSCVTPVFDIDESKLEREAIGWLLRYKSFLDGLKSHERLAIYGTGPAGAWTGVILGNKISAYVDDDPARIHSIFNAKPVVSVQEIERSQPVIAAFPHGQAQMVAEKNKGLNIIVCP